MVPPRRTRAMGFSPGGAKALDISAPSRKRKNQPQQEEVSEPAEVHKDRPAKRTRAKTTTPEPSADDNKKPRAPPKKTTTSTQTRSTRRIGAQASTSNDDDATNLAETITTSSPTKRRPVRRTRGQANTEPQDNALKTDEVPVLTSAEVPSKKRTRAQLSLESPSEDDSQPQNAPTLLEAKPRPSKRTRVHSHTRPPHPSTSLTSKSQGNSARTTEDSSDEESESAQQPSPPGSGSPTMATAATQVTSDSEHDLSDARSDVSQEAPGSAAFESDAVSVTSENTSEVRQDVEQFGNKDSEADADTSSDDIEYHHHSAEIAPHSPANGRLSPGISAPSSTRQQTAASQSRALSFPQIPKTKSQPTDLQQLTEEDLTDINHVRNKSSAWKFAQSIQRRKAVDDEEMEEEHWERLYAQRSIPKDPPKFSQKDIDKARHAGAIAERNRGHANHVSKVTSTRSFEWVDDSDAMFVVRSKDQFTTAAIGVGSNREKNFSSNPILLAPNVRAIPLTNPKIIDAVSTTIQLCLENPEGIPTNSELSSFFKGVAQSRQPQPVTPSTPPPRAQPLFAGSQNTLSPVTPTSQHLRDSSIAGHSTSDVQTVPAGDVGGITERQEPIQDAVQPEPGRVGWAAALSASRIGTLLQTPLRLFSRGNRAQQNAPATDVRRIAAKPTQGNITRSERQHRKPRPITFDGTRANPSSTSRSSREHEAPHTLSTDLPSTPTSAAQKIPNGRRRDAHLPVEWRGVRYQDLPPDLQAISQHMKPAEAPGSKTLSAEEQQFLDDNHEAIQKQREINMKRIMSGRIGLDAFREEEDFTQVTQDLSRDQPGTKRKRVTFALNKNASKKPNSGTFAVPDDSDSDSDPSIILEESSPSSRRRKKRTPHQPIPGSFSPDEGQDGSPPAKKARGESKEKRVMGPHLWLNMTAKDVYGPNFGEPLIPSVVYRRYEPEPEPPLLQRPAQRDDNVFVEPPQALNEISANRAVNQKQIIHDSFQKSQKHMPKNPSTLRHVTTMSPATSPGAPIPGRDSVATASPAPTIPTTKSDYGSFVTDPAVLALINSIPEERIVAEKFPLSVYEAVTGLIHPSRSE